MFLIYVVFLDTLRYVIPTTSWNGL